MYLAEIRFRHIKVIFMLTEHLKYLKYNYNIFVFFYGAFRGNFSLL